MITAVQSDVDLQPRWRWSLVETVGSIEADADGRCHFLAPPVMETLIVGIQVEPGGRPLGALVTAIEVRPHALGRPVVAGEPGLHCLADGLHHLLPGE